MHPCPRCGQENPDGARFCNACAAPLAVDDALRLEERKVVTVLFADLVGFTSRAERMDPEEVRSLLRPYHARLRDELERFGGTVEKFIGDAVMAVFGAPVAHEDDAERAVRAALAIRDWILDEQVELQLRIGVNTGQALVSLGARPEEGEGMVAGDVVNTAARLQSNAPVNGILVGKTTCRATRDAIDYRPAEPVHAKGKAEPVDAWEALEARGRVGVDISTRVRTPLVGRRRELDSLLDAFERTWGARSVQLVTLVGEPGIGKSRLVYELFEAVERHSELVFWRQGGSLPYGEGVSFWALGEMIKAHTGILETDDEEKANRKLRASVMAAVPADRSMDDRTAPPIGGHRGHGRQKRQPGRSVRRLAGLPRGRRGPTPARPRIRGSALGGRGLARLRRPPRRLGDARAAARSRHGPPGAAFETLRLGRRQDECAHALARPTIRRRDGAARACAARARRDLRRPTGDTTRARRRQPAVRGGVRASARRALRHASLPETVQGIIAARLDALDRGEKELLQDAAVLGRVFWVGGLHGSAIRRRPPSIDWSDASSCNASGGVPSRTKPNMHSGTLSSARSHTSRSHGRSVETSTAASPTGWRPSAAPRIFAELLAHHYIAVLEYSEPDAELSIRAAHALGEAGDRALALNAYLAAAGFYRRALSSLQTRSADTLLFGLGSALSALADPEAAERLAEASEMLVKAGDNETAAEAECVLAQMAFDTGDAPGVTRHVGRALELVRGRPPSAAHAQALSQAARFQMLGGEWSDAVESGEEAERMATELGLDAIRADALVTVGTARSSILGIHVARTISRRRSSWPRQANAPQALLRALNNLAWRYTAIDMRRAHELKERQYETARRYGNIRQTWWARTQLRQTAFETGRWDEALEHAEAVIAHVEAGNPLYNEAACRLVRAAITVARGDAGRSKPRSIVHSLSQPRRPTPRQRGPSPSTPRISASGQAIARARSSCSNRRSARRARAKSGSISSTTRRRFWQHSWSWIPLSLRYRRSRSPKHHDSGRPPPCSKAISSPQRTRSRTSGK